MPGEVPARQQDGTSRMKVFGRYLEPLGGHNRIRWLPVGSLIGKDKRGEAAASQWRLANYSHGFYARDRRYGIDHALLHDGYLVATVIRHVQLSVRQHHVLWLETKIAAQGAHQSAHRNHRRSDQNGTDRNLSRQQQFADGNSPSYRAAWSRFDDLVGI